MQVIDEATLRARVGPASALDAVEAAFRALGEGRVTLPPPMGLEIAPVGGEVHVKGAYLAGAPVFAVKIASGFYANAERGLPSGSGLMLVFDASTGFPLALLQDNGYLTDLRTAAAGALAAKLLTAEPLGKVAIIGSGLQARFQSRALADVRTWRQLVVWGRHPEHAERCAAELAEQLDRPVEAAESAEAAVRDAGLIVTVTPSRVPLVEADWVGDGATVIAVGSDGPDKQELSSSVLERADKVVADRIAQCVELGEIHHAICEGVLTRDQIHGELGQIVIGEVAGREGGERIVCDLTGVGVQDAAIAEAAWRATCSETPPA
jgi:ornithine cyclodeaminase